MLIRFRVSNFRSLRDEQELSLVAAFRQGRSDLVPADALGLDLVRVAGIYGSNAAGKTNVLDAIRFMRDAVVDSHRRWKLSGPILREPFLLDPESRSAPSMFEMDFLLEGTHFQYGFELDSERILREWLSAFPNKRRQVWFRRDSDSSEPFHFGKHFRGNNRAIERLTRKNSLFLSAAAEAGHEALSRVRSWFADRLFLADVASREHLTQFTADLLEARREAVVDFLQLADLGIVDVDLKEPTTRSRPEAHRGGRFPAGVLEFKHQTKGGAVSLPLAGQSRGTQAWFALAGPVLEALDKGGLLCLDEIDSSLHPLLTLELIRIFQSPRRNPKNAQMIFNAHDTTLLGNLLNETPTLYRDQIWFIEKGEDGASSLYPLTDFKPRKLENIERGYLQGRYGAVPFIDPSEAA